MNNTKKRAESKIDTANAMNRLNNKLKPNKEKIRERTGISITKIKMHVKTDVDRYSTKVFFISLIFKSFFKSVNKFKWGSNVFPKWCRAIFP